MSAKPMVLRFKYSTGGWWLEKIRSFPTVTFQDYRSNGPWDKHGEASCSLREHTVIFG